MTESRVGPSVLDAVDLVLLRLAKSRRPRFSGSESFYESFFGQHDLIKYREDVRNTWRYQRIGYELGRLGGASSVVLDIGCGLGVLVHSLPDNVHYRGLDPSQTTVEHARRIAGKPEVEFALGGFPELPVASNVCDFAVCLEVLEHLPGDEQAVAELARVMRPGGHLLVSVPGTYYWSSYLSLIGHYRHYTASGLTSLLERHGFEVVRRYPMLLRLWRFHHYAYVGVRSWGRVRRRLSPAKEWSVYVNPFYRALSRRVLAAAQRREHEEDPNSTFVLARFHAEEL